MESRMLAASSAATCAMETAAASGVQGGARSSCSEGGTSLKTVAVRGAEMAAT
jgi:hypothetical protein